MRALYRRLATSRLAHDQRGLTLVEITVAIFLFSLVSAVVVAMFVSVMRGSNVNNKINLDTRTASNGMNEMARMTRAATENPLLNPAPGVYPNEAAVLAADSGTITLYAYVNLASSDETPVIVRFSVNGKRQLVEAKRAATSMVSSHWNFSPTWGPDRVLADNVIPGTALFAYYSASNQVIPIPTGGIVDATARQSIRSVQITLQVRSPGSSTGITLQNTVGMPNLGFTRTGTGS